MGGRGRSSGLGSRQSTIDDAQRQNIVSGIIKESKLRRSVISSGGRGGTASPKLLKKCACCGEYSIPIGTEYEVCPICGWIDDAFQNTHPNSLDGRNPISLLEAQAIYQRQGNQEQAKESMAKHSKGKAGRTVSSH